MIHYKIKYNIIQIIIYIYESNYKNKITAMDNLLVIIPKANILKNNMIIIYNKI